MTIHSTATRSDNATLAASPRTSFSLRGGVFQLLGLWSQRVRTRRALAALDHHGLADIGIDIEAAHAEATKPFWR